MWGMLIKLKAKVLLTSEEQMEAEEKYDLGDIAKSKEWVWRQIAIPLEEVYKIVEYNKSKTIVQTYDDEKILINEPFDDLYTRWEVLKIQIGELPSRHQSQEEEEENEE